MHRNLHARMEAMRANWLSSPSHLTPSAHLSSPKRSIVMKQVKLCINTLAGIQGGITYNLYVVVHGLQKEAA